MVVTDTTTRALRDFQPDDTDPVASLFDLTGETVANRARAAARAADLGKGFSGHSGRIGMAQRMVAAGAPAVRRELGAGRRGDTVQPLNSPVFVAALSIRLWHQTSNLCSRFLPQPFFQHAAVFQASCSALGGAWSGTESCLPRHSVSFR